MSGGRTIRVPVSLETSYPLLAPARGVVIKRTARAATCREEADNPFFQKSLRMCALSPAGLLPGRRDFSLHKEKRKGF